MLRAPLYSTTLIDSIKKDLKFMWANQLSRLGNKGQKDLTNAVSAVIGVDHAHWKTVISSKVLFSLGSFWLLQLNFQSKGMSLGGFHLFHS